jgi:hypothetical protein
VLFLSCSRQQPPSHIAVDPAVAALYTSPSCIVVESVIPCSIPTSPARSRLQSKVVVVPYVIKKFQESGEDEASSVEFV